MEQRGPKHPVEMPVRNDGMIDEDRYEPKYYVMDPETVDLLPFVKLRNCYEVLCEEPSLRQDIPTEVEITSLWPSEIRMMNKWNRWAMVTQLDLEEEFFVAVYPDGMKASMSIMDSGARFWYVKKASMWDVEHSDNRLVEH